MSAPRIRIFCITVMKDVDVITHKWCITSLFQLLIIWGSTYAACLVIKISICLNVYEVAASETYFCFCTFFPFCFSAIKIHWFYTNIYTVLFCGFLIRFFQLGPSHRSCETLGENICTRQGATLQNWNKEIAFAVVAVLPVHKPQEHLGQ